MEVAVVLGTRPEIIKMARVVHELQRRGLDFRLVHTGQHYDYEMSQVFFEELNVPAPDEYLGVMSGSHGYQTARIIERSEKVLGDMKPDMVLIEGDTNSAMGVALASAKIKIPVGHVEAGCRSFDPWMPEEINRKVIADCAQLHFAPTKTAYENLLREGVPEEAVFLTGHPLVDLLEWIRPKVRSSKVLEELGLEEKEYALLTVHREENVENEARLRSIVAAISKVDLEVVFPAHPRTRKKLASYGLGNLLGSNVRLIEPQPYSSTLRLIEGARVVFTDSGGIQQESYLLGVPCITLRERTEWVETVELGVNFLAGASEDGILKAYERVLSRESDIKKKLAASKKDIFGDGTAARKIVDLVLEYLEQRS